MTNEKENKLLTTEEFALKIEAMTTKEFCQYSGAKEPVFTGEVKSSAMLFLRLDAIKYRLIRDHAKARSRERHRPDVEALKDRLERLLDTAHNEHSFDRDVIDAVIKLFLPNLQGQQGSEAVEFAEYFHEKTTGAWIDTDRCKKWKIRRDDYVSEYKTTKELYTEFQNQKTK